MKRTHSKDQPGALVKTGGVNDPIKTDENKAYANTTSSSSSSKKTGTESYVYQGGVGTFASYMKPTPAFKWHGVEFWGSARTNLDDIPLTPKDFIINCSGTSYVSKPFVMKSPAWLNLGGLGEKPVDQLLLEWRDFGAPPELANLEFWKKILDSAVEHGVERIICCCGAGQGRTGTALASLLLATGATQEPDIAIDYIRKNYSDKAIENKTQEFYIWNLLYTEEELFGKDPVVTTTPPPIPSSSSSSYNSGVADDDDLDGWIVGSTYRTSGN